MKLLQKKLKVTQYKDPNNTHNSGSKKSIKDKTPVVVSKKNIVLPGLEGTKVSEG